MPWAGNKCYKRDYDKSECKGNEADETDREKDFTFYHNCV